MLDARKYCHLSQSDVIQIQNADPVKHVETASVLIHVLLKIHVLHLPYVQLTTTDLAANVHLDLQAIQDLNVAKSREENVTMMMSVPIIRHV